MANELLIGLDGYWGLEQVPPHLDASGKGNTINVLAGSSFSTVAGANLLGNLQGASSADRRGIVSQSSFHYADESFSGRIFVHGSTADWNDANSDPLAGVWNDFGGATEKNWLIYWDATSDQFVFLLSSDGSAHSTVVSSSGQPADDTWVQVAFGYDAVANKIWIQYEGDSRVTAAHTGGGYAASTAPFSLGWAGAFTTEFRMGAYAYDEFALWNRLLSEADVTVLRTTFFESFDSGESGNMFVLVPGALEDLLDDIFRS